MKLAKFSKRQLKPLTQSTVQPRIILLCRQHSRKIDPMMLSLNNKTELEDAFVNCVLMLTKLVRQFRNVLKRSADRARIRKKF